MFHPFRTGRLPPQWPVSQTLSPTLASLPTLRSLNGLVLKGGFGWTTEPTESAETADRHHTKRVLVARMRSGDFEMKDKITRRCYWVPPYSPPFSFSLSFPETLASHVRRVGPPYCTREWHVSPVSRVHIVLAAGTKVRVSIATKIPHCMNRRRTSKTDNGPFSQYYGVATTTILFYDYLLTLADEVR